MTRPSPQTDRVVAVIDLMVRRPDEAFTLAEISRRLQVHKQTCHSMLTALTEAGWLLRDPVRKTFRLGPALVAAGRAAARELPVLDVAHPALVDLAERFDATAALITARGGQVVVLDVASPRGVPQGPLAIGHSFPLRAPVCGALVAWADESAVEAWIDEVEQPEQRDAFTAALGAIRERGVEIRLRPALADVVERFQADFDPEALGTIEAGELLTGLVTQILGQPDQLVGDLEPDADYPMGSVNVPVWGPEGTVVHALSLSFGTASRSGAQLRDVAAAAVDAAGAVSRSIGGRPPG